MLLKRSATLAREGSAISYVPSLISDPFSGPCQFPPLFSDPSTTLRSSTPAWDTSSVSSTASARVYSNKLPLLPDQRVALAVFKPVLQVYTTFRNPFPGPVDLQALWLERMPGLMEYPPSYCDGSLMREVGNSKSMLAVLLNSVDPKDSISGPDPYRRSCEYCLR